eukprot:TRINITY_DN1381_c0_g4_i2.p1 TRINITY_DN1381_c0_g4~~TRINITY_DN1381_c0_g4_i2.p1  ORF type:complete len:459 (-),score=91.96 TRINITY_DN1381_c0_g4_i2:83-1459(-)
MLPADAAVGSEDGNLLGHKEAKTTLFASGGKAGSRGVQGGPLGGRSGTASADPSQAWRAAALLRGGPALASRTKPSAATEDPAPAGLKTGARQDQSGSRARAIDLAVDESGTLFVGTDKREIWGFERCGRGYGEGFVVTSGHHGSVQALATHPSRETTYATAAEDGQLCIWAVGYPDPVCRALLPRGGRSLAWSPDGRWLAAGLKRGAIAVYTADTLRRVAAWRHCEEDIDDLKFSPDGKSLAAASHDNFIDIYALDSEGAGGLRCKRTARCRGHTSYVTHIDWSADSRVIQSTCGANELLYWDAATGKALRSSRDNIEGDGHWATYTCTLGFPVMAIWPPNSDGTDINALQRSSDQRVVATADDFGGVSLFNCPCITAGAPKRRYHGHSAHVMNVRFTCGDRYLITVGGNDKSILEWRYHNRPPPPDSMQATQGSAQGQAAERRRGHGGKATRAAWG